MTPFPALPRPCYMEWINISHLPFLTPILILKFFQMKLPKLPNIIKLHTRSTNATKFLLKNIRPYETPVKKSVLRKRKEPTTRKPPRLPSWKSLIATFTRWSHRLLIFLKHLFQHWNVQTVLWLWIQFASRLTGKRLNIELDVSCLLARYLLKCLEKCYYTTNSETRL